MASGEEKVETPTGSINGANLNFFTTLPYVPGTLHVWTDGVLCRAADDDGWIETDPSTGAFQMREPPRISKRDDVLMVRYIEA